MKIELDIPIDLYRFKQSLDLLTEPTEPESGIPVDIEIQYGNNHIKGHSIAIKRIGDRMVFLVFTLVFFLFGCFSDIENGRPLPSSQHVVIETVNAWEQVMGRISTECYAYLRNVPIYEIKSELFTDLPCRSDEGRVDGCYLPYSEQIYILSTLNEYEKIDTIAHELIHAAHHCEFDDPDYIHSLSELWVSFGPGSVEAIALSSL